jgi:hypothetical protein
VRVAIEVVAALGVGVKYVPFNVPLLHEIVTLAVAVSLTVAGDMVEAWLAPGVLERKVEGGVWLVFVR